MKPEALLATTNSFGQCGFKARNVHPKLPESAEVKKYGAAVD
jgi:hypothetical protein